ncbi:MAG: hypothetical protein BMS9Abin26_0192 [Gammaproteobacteria bacterium]|nr:MAG: hypothetical protein BMS9Abin26_0192 [Gammaproteobacteria bacterium]
MANIKPSTLILVFLAGIVVAVFLVFANSIYVSWVSGRYRKASELTEGLNLIHQARVMVEQSYLETGEWPDNNRDIGLPDEIKTSSKVIQRLTISDGGKITLTLRAGFMKAGTRLVYVPVSNEVAALAGNVFWECRSDLDEDIVEILALRCSPLN